MANLPPPPTLPPGGLKQPPPLVPYPSLGAKRLIWSFNLPFPSCISVLKDRFNPNSSEPYYHNNQYHPIALDPVSQPECNSITVNVSCLKSWEWDWSEAHARCGNVRGQNPGKEQVVDDNEDVMEELLACSACGEERPVDKSPTITVTPMSGDFVTVYDYISTIQPWLVQLRGDIEKALVVYSQRLPEELVVGCDASLTSLEIEDKSIWLATRPAYTEPLNARWVSMSERPVEKEQEYLLALMAATRDRQESS